MKKAISIILVIVVVLTCGCSQQTEKSSQRLLISAVTDTESTTTINKEDLNGNYDGNLRFQNVTDVAITLNSKSYPLERAIADGLITVDEIEAYARIDARNGFCKEIAESDRGVSHFIYRYQGVCDLYFTHDVYETPNGSDPVTTYFAVCNNNGMDNSFYLGGNTMYNVLDQNYPSDMEDWKLNFEVTDVSPTGFTLNIRQNDSPIKQFRSQHLGQLKLTAFELYDLESMDSYFYRFNSDDSVIIPNENSVFEILFSEFEDPQETLPSGSYRIFLDITDEFNESDIHPLMQDYYHTQGYWISFDIP